MTDESSTPDTPMTTYSDYTTKVGEQLAAYPHWRRGQAAFNVLWAMREDLADKVSTTQLDPFYRDDRLPEFFGWVEENWDAKPKG